MPTSKTILLVEDDAQLRVLVKKSLEYSGYTVIAAEDSTVANAQARMRGGIIDMILADINLPGLTGGEYADYLKTINPNLRILYMSGATVVDESVRRHIRAKKADFIGKPFTLEELDLKVKRTLGLLPPRPPDDEESPEPGRP
jgi:two-component system, cell cycle sensor histidine kinase and response regulator CckA